MKKIILITLLSIIYLSLYSREINITGKFGNSANIDESIDIEIGAELITDNFYIQTVGGHKDNTEYLNYELSIKYDYYFKKTVWERGVLALKELSETDSSNVPLYQLAKKKQPPKKINTPFGVQAGARTLKVDLKDIKFTEISLKALYKYKSNKVSLFLFKYILDGNYLVGVTHQWEDSKTPPSTKIIIERTLKHKFWHIMSMDYSIAYLSSDFKKFDNEMYVRISADIYIFNVFFRYSQKDYGKSTMNGQFGIGYKF